MMFLLYVVVFVVAGYLLISYYISKSGPKKISYDPEKKVVKIEWNEPPTAASFYTRVVFSRYNLLKGSHLPDSGFRTRYEITASEQTDLKNLAKYVDVIKFPTKDQLPFGFHFATSLPLASPAVVHPTWPTKPMVSLIHISQKVNQLRPIKPDEKIFKRVIVQGGGRTERGSEFEIAIELYTSEDLNPSSLIATGQSGFLIVRKRSAAVAPKGEEDLPVTKKIEFNVPKDAGWNYASVSGDYNPWHISDTLAKVFGFKKAIVQGYWSLNRTLSEITSAGLFPKYPVQLKMEWKKPIFMPSSLALTLRKNDEANLLKFSLFSQDGVHHHLEGSLQHDAGMKLSKIEL